MPQRIRYVKSSPKTPFIPTNQKQSHALTTNEKVLLFLTVGTLLALFVLPYWLELFKRFFR